jgi:hypothetical protein
MTYTVSYNCTMQGQDGITRIGRNRCGVYATVAEAESWIQRATARSSPEAVKWAAYRVQTEADWLANR